MNLKVKKLNNKEEMLACHHVIAEMYPSLDVVTYNKELDKMLPHNYFQIGVFEEDECIGISGAWIGNKLWCGKYLEVDHIIVCSKHRSSGAGRLLLNFLKKIAQEEKCASLGLDSFTHNSQSHKFFFKEGFEIKGYHFVQVLDESKFK